VSGLGVAINTANLYMFLNAYAHAVGKRMKKLSVPINDMERRFEMETMAGGYFNEPLQSSLPETVLAAFSSLKELPAAKAQRWLWEHYCGMTCTQRAEFIKSALGIHEVTSESIEALRKVFGQRISHDAFSIPHANPVELAREIQGAPLIRTGWYDWCLNDALATWRLLRESGKPARMIITPHSHATLGYREGIDQHPELLRQPTNFNMSGLVLRWYAAVREGNVDAWPAVIYYLMGANEWRVATDWPVSESAQINFYLGAEGSLTAAAPSMDSPPDRYTYDPTNPTPTIGGSIVSYVYTPGSVDVSRVQERSDVLVYTSARLESDLDVVGPLRMYLYASSTATDTDFVARVSDVFPDGRAVQIQSGILRTRYRNLEGEPELLVPGEVYRFDIDLWATANRFKAGHRVRVDISSADFPHFDRNSNRGGAPGEPIRAQQTIYHDRRYPSHLMVTVLGKHEFAKAGTC
jgi:putative CocE/NonD family hydrolase